MVKNFTKKNLAEQIYKKVGFSKNFSSVLIDNFINILKDELINSQKVKMSSFGTFEVVNKNQRIGRNPKTKVLAKISARKIVKFKSSNYIKNKLNGL